MRRLAGFVFALAALALAAGSAGAEEKPPPGAVKLTRAQVDSVCGEGRSCYLMPCGNGHSCNYSCNTKECFGYCIDCGVKPARTAGGQKGLRDLVMGGVKSATMSSPKAKVPPAGLLGAGAATGTGNSAAPAATGAPAAAPPPKPVFQ